MKENNIKNTISDLINEIKTTTENNLNNLQQIMEALIIILPKEVFIILFFFPHKIYNIEFIVWTDYIVAKKIAMNGDYSDFGFPSRNRLANAKILFIDDIGGEMPSDWEMRELLFPLLNYRIENKLTTFFTSNFSLTALKEYYEKKCDPLAVGRVIDRIQGLTQQELIEGENWRHKKFII